MRKRLRRGGKNKKVENGTGNKVIEWTKWIERKESQRAGNNTSERQSLFFWAFSPFDFFFFFSQSTVVSPSPVSSNIRRK